MVELNFLKMEMAQPNMRESTFVVFIIITKIYIFVSPVVREIFYRTQFVLLRSHLKQIQLLICIILISSVFSIIGVSALIVILWSKLND